MKTFWENTYRLTDIPWYDIDTNSEKMAGSELSRWIDNLHDPVGSTDELEQYLSEPVLSKTQVSTPLAWWRHSSQRERFLLLSIMAIDIFSIPAMSSEAERVFSGAKQTLTDDRGSMKINTLEAVECLKSWFQSSIFENPELQEALVMAMGLEEHTSNSE